MKTYWLVALCALLGISSLSLAGCGDDDGGTDATVDTGEGDSTDDPDTDDNIDETPDPDPTPDPEVVPDSPTYHEHIAPIVAARCLNCHAEDGIGPFPLEDYEEVRLQGARMLGAVTSRTMPPFGVDASGDCNEYKDDNWMSDVEIATIEKWFDNEMPEGDAENAAPLPAPPEWTEIETTHEILIGEDYTPDGSLTDDYKCFIVDPGVVGEDLFLTGFEVVPGNAQIVHHAILYTLDSDEAEQRAEERAMEEGTPGRYTCFGGPRVPDSRFVVGWAPGGPPTHYPTGSGPRIHAGRKAVLQIHYNLAGGPGSDRTGMKLELKAGQSEAYIVPIADFRMRLEPGMEYTETSLTQSLDMLPIPVRVHGVAPHMHTAGRTLTVRRQDNSCLVDSPNYDFNWQQMYFYDEPLRINPSDELTITCGYDTRGRDSVTTFGEGTSDEMCIAFFYVTL